MPAENVPHGASSDLETLLNAFVEVPAPTTVHLREAVTAMGTDPDEAVAQVRALIAAAAHEVRVPGPRSANGIIGRVWLDRRFLKLGTGAGMLGGICCLGKAVTVSAGLAISSFFSMMVDRYQGHFVVGSLVLLLVLVAIWLVRSARAQTAASIGVRTLLRGSAMQAAVSFGTYFVTLGFTMATMALADWLWPRS